jgi:O-antigen ligase
MGHGVGSWISTVKRFEGASASAVFGDSNSSNPHQEYLLWGVEYGVGGTLLLIAIFFSFVKDSLAFRKPVARATISVTVALSVACLFNSALYDGLVGDFFCVTLGLLMSYGLQTRLTSQAHEQQIRRKILG